MRQQCIDNQTPPALEPGDTVESGQFFRHVLKDHVVKRYEGDSDDNPAYGFKIKEKHWTHASRPPGALSVNLTTCIHSEKCSLALHEPGGERYYHVGVLDLGAINGSGLLSSPLVAKYEPVSPNRCHFEIVPRDGTVMVWMEFRDVLDGDFPEVKLPRNETERDCASKAAERYRSFIEIKRWVRARDGTLA